MLILSRKIDESIIIGAGTPDEMVVTVVRIDGDKCRIGIAAPRHITVNREEIQRRIDAGEVVAGRRVD